MRNVPRATQFNDKPTVEYLAAVAALKKIGDIDLAGRAYADAVADDRKRAWAESYGLRESTRVPCRHILFGKQCGHSRMKGCPNHSIIGLDHPTVWHINRHPVIVSQVYNIGSRMTDDIAKLECQGVEVHISTFPDFHYPGAIIAIQYWSAAAHAAQLKWQKAQRG